MKGRYFFSVSFACVLLVGAGYYLFFSKSSYRSRTPTNFSVKGSVEKSAQKGVDVAVEELRWRERIATVGAAAAYGEFKQAYRARHFSDQHIAAHILGELIYEAEGIEGVAVCDGSFSFGCYHSFFARAVAEEGTGVLTDLDQACIAAHGVFGVGCQHGIGHGLVEYLGTDRIVEALEFCGALRWQEPLLGCQSGVFMEYNFPLVIGKTASITRRPYDPDRIYEPCLSVPERFRKACYYEIGQWWAKWNDVKAIGAICSGVGNREERETCFFGIGNVVAPSNDYDVKRTLQACDAMPDKESELWCRAGASWSFFALLEHRDSASKLCEGFDDSVERSACAEAADLFDMQHPRK